MYLKLDLRFAACVPKALPVSRLSPQGSGRESCLFDLAKGKKPPDLIGVMGVLVSTVLVRTMWELTVRVDLLLEH